MASSIAKERDSLFRKDSTMGLNRLSYVGPVPRIFDSIRGTTASEQVVFRAISARCACFFVDALGHSTMHMVAAAMVPSPKATLAVLTSLNGEDPTAISMIFYGDRFFGTSLWCRNRHRKSKYL